MPSGSPRAPLDRLRIHRPEAKPKVKKHLSFYAMPFYTKHDITLPRQARDKKPSEKLRQKRVCFLAAGQTPPTRRISHAIGMTATARHGSSSPALHLAPRQRGRTALRSAMRRSTAVRQPRPFWVPFPCKNDMLTKTGSGQTEENLRKRGAFFCRLLTRRQHSGLNDLQRPCL